MHKYQVQMGNVKYYAGALKMDVSMMMMMMIRNIQYAKHAKQQSKTNTLLKNYIIQTKLLNIA